MLFSLTAGEVVEVKRAGFRAGNLIIQIHHATNYGTFGCVKSGTVGVNETATATLISASGTGTSGTKDASSVNMYYLNGKLYLQNGTAGTLNNIGVTIQALNAKNNI